MSIAENKKISTTQAQDVSIVHLRTTLAKRITEQVCTTLTKQISLGGADQVICRSALGVIFLPAAKVILFADAHSDIIFAASLIRTYVAHTSTVHRRATLAVGEYN